MGQGKRVPSQLTVEELADVLPLDDDVLAGLRRVAGGPVRGAGWVPVVGMRACCVCD